MIRIENIITAFREVNGKQVDCGLIQKAYIIAAKSETFLKIIPSLYLQNALEVAQILIDLKLDIQTVAAGILYGVFLKDEDKPTSNKKKSFNEIEDLLGKEAADIVEGIHNILKASNIEDKEKRMAEKMRQMIFASSKDIRIIFVSLAARLVRMRYSKRFYNFAHSIDSGETLKIYAPLADRLGLSHIKIELENLAFAHLYPKESKQIELFYKKNEKLHSSLLQTLRDETQKLLLDNKIQGLVKGRLKHSYSIFKKSQKTGVDYDQLHDLVGVRIIVDSIDGCYKALGIINNFYHPVSTSFKNYISFPKPNGYQSLHIDVYDRNGSSFDVQIRTQKMDEIAERGVAAHWAYKKKQGGDSEEVSVAWLQDLSKSLNFTSDAGESLEIFSRELYSDFVYVLTPRGKMMKLQSGATVLDFAFAVHTEIGLRCVGAKINGINRPIKTALKHGDKVEVLTSSKQTPSPDWRLWAKTSKALAKIRNYLRKEEREEAKILGQELFLSYVAKSDKNKKEILKSNELTSFIRKKGNTNINGYYEQLGFGKYSVEELDKIFKPVANKKSILEEIPKKVLTFSQARTGVRIVGTDNIGSNNMAIRYAKCCRPLKGDKIAGVISQGQGVAVHLVDCGNISGIAPERIVELEWLKSLSEKLPVSVKLLFNNNIKTSLKIMKVLAGAKVTILKSNMRVKFEDDMVSEQTMTIKVDNSEQLEKILKKFNSLSSVKAYRLKDETEPQNQKSIRMANRT